MNEIQNVIAVILAVMGIAAVALNYLYFYQNLRNRKLGIERHVSLVVAVPQIFLFLSWQFGKQAIGIYVPGFVFITIGAIDPCIWIYLKIALIGRAKK